MKKRKSRIVSILQDVTIAMFFIGYIVWFFIAPLGA